MAKVNVLTVDDVAFKKWHWWSCWIDIAVFDISPISGHTKCYLLQMRISRSNAKQFKTRAMPNYCKSQWVGDLTQMSGESQ